MNRERHRYWESYIRDLQSRMLLGHWHIVLSREATDDEADVRFRGMTREVTMRLAENFDDATRSDQRRTVVHELVHVHLNPLLQHLELQMNGQSEGERALAQGGHRSHEEYAVEDLVRIIAPHMPLPPKVKS